MKDLLLKDINLQLFAELNTNVTTDSGLSEEMKTFYSDYLIDQAGPKLVHDQFGQKHPACLPRSFVACTRLLSIAVKRSTSESVM